MMPTPSGQRFLSSGTLKPQAGPVAHRRSGGRREVIYGLAPGSAANDALVDRLVRAHVAGQLLPLSEPGSLWFCMALEGFASLDDMASAWGQLGHVYRGPFGDCLDWTSADGRLHRAILGSLTTISLARNAQVPRFDRAMGQFLDAAETAVGSRLDPQDLLRAVIGRLHTLTPGDIYAHLSGDVPLTTVSRSCLARLDAKQALRPKHSGESTKSTLRASVRAQVADAAFASCTVDAQEIQCCLQAIADACKMDSEGGGAPGQRDRMLRRLENTAPHVIRIGGWLPIFWGWAVSLVEDGTRRTSPLMPSAIDPYVRRTVSPLAGALLARDPHDLHGIDWSAVRRQTLDAVTERTQLGKVSAAFVSLHEYLQSAHGVEHRAWPRDDEGDAPLPRANLVWPHECAWVRSRLAAAAESGRFAAQLETAFAFWSGQPTRFEDVWRVHMFGIRDDGTRLVLYLDPLVDADPESPSKLGARSSSRARRPARCEPGSSAERSSFPTYICRTSSVNKPCSLAIL